MDGLNGVGLNGFAAEVRKRDMRNHGTGRGWLE